MKKSIKLLSLMLCFVLAISLCIACGNNELIYEGKTLKAGTVGVYYEDNVDFATGSKEITYECISYLPDGLELSEDGKLFGTPLESFSENEDGTVEIMASAEGCEDVFAEFVLEIASGKLSYTGKALADAETGVPYSATVFVDNDLSGVTYALKDSVLPAGLYLNSSGSITGLPLSEAEGHEFKVSASVSGYVTAVAEFVITVKKGDNEIRIGDEILYDEKGMSIALEDALVGSVISANLTADQIVSDKDKNLETRYSYVAIDGVGLVKGLALEQTGFLTGIPGDSTHGKLNFKVKSFVVTISDTPAPASKPTLSGYVETENTDYASVVIDVSVQILDLEVTTNKYEAELIDLTGKQGSGYSSDPSGTKMISERIGVCSGNYSLGYLHVDGIFVDFNISSESVATGVLKVRIGSEVGTCTYSDEQFKVEVNGEKISYGSLTISGSEVEETIGDFQTFTIGNISLIKGANQIRITIGKNNYLDGQRAAGPEIDYIEIDSATTLKWRPKVANLDFS